MGSSSSPSNSTRTRSIIIIAASSRSCSTRIYRRAAAATSTGRFILTAAPIRTIIPACITTARRVRAGSGGSSTAISWRNVYRSRRTATKPMAGAVTWADASPTTI